MRTFIGRTSAALAVASVLAAVPGMLPAGAEDHSAEVTASTVYASPVTDAIPRAILSLANPSLMCIFAPQACPPEAADVLLLASDPAGVLIDPNAQAAPVQPMVPPGMIAVGLLGGTVRYQSALKFDVPPLPQGQEYDSFDVTLQQEQPSYNSSSPLFREVVNAALVLPDDPELGAQALQDAFAASPIDQKVLDIRVCPLTEPFESTEAPAVATDDQIPHDEFGAPEVTCRLGAFGQFDEASATWTFDLAAAANEWARGDHAQHGLFMEPVPVNFVGIGDEDPTTYAQATLDATQVTIASSTTASVTPTAPAAPAVPDEAAGTAADSETADQASSTPASLPVAVSPVTIPPAASVGSAAPPDPEVADETGAAGDGPAAADSQSATGVDGVTAAPTITPATSEVVPESLRLSALLALLAAGTGALALAMRQRQPRAVVVGVGSASSSEPSAS